MTTSNTEFFSSVIADVTERVSATAAQFAQTGSASDRLSHCNAVLRNKVANKLVNADGVADFLYSAVQDDTGRKYIDPNTTPNAYSLEDLASYADAILAQDSARIAAHRAGTLEAFKNTTTWLSVEQAHARAGSFNISQVRNCIRALKFLGVLETKEETTQCVARPAKHLFRLVKSDGAKDAKKLAKERMKKRLA